MNRANFYRFVGKPIGQGGFAVVRKAKRKSDGEIVAFKQPLNDEIARQRIRREIDVQTQLAHPNIMPILHADPDRMWFTMPLAEGHMLQLREELVEEDLYNILYDVAGALAVAHAAGFIHRDVTPNNILALPRTSGRGGRRWVIADWGLVRRPDSQVSRQITRSQHIVGTYGFMAPETFVDGHDATAASDVYSLGRVAAWFLRRRLPYGHTELLPEGEMQHWRAFVRACTAPEVDRRPSDMAAVKERLTKVFDAPLLQPAQQAKAAVDDIILQNGSDIQEAASIALTYSNDPLVFVDQIARLPSVHVEAWTRRHPHDAAKVARRMLYHLETMSWSGRDPDYVNTPLAFVHAVLRVLVGQQLGLAEDVAEDFFRAELRWDTWRQKIRTESWLADLAEPEGEAIARALRGANAVDYHQQASTWAARSQVIRNILVPERT
ncbi:protein kinase domain-containing protein [Plantactinospora sp. WMMC1484]|uniref:protein kinase domain-containing protein n=1 Tax=Plantactinospora sp. WMMC1484 TaxID=3404122 RepID=UPI003BF57525